MAVKFQPKPGKPHILIEEYSNRLYALSVLQDFEGRDFNLAWDYIDRVNAVFYNSPGEAARALHYGSEKK